MTRRRAVLFAIIASVLMVTAMPVAASSHTQLVVGSEHSTATEFNNAKTLDNVEVDGTGDSAHVQLAEVNQFVDGAEDGDVAEYSTSGGGGTNYGFSTTTDAASGTYGMQHELEGSGPAATWTVTRDVNLGVQDGESATVSLTHKLASSSDGNPDFEAEADLLVDVTLADGSTERITYVLATVDGSADTDPANLTFAAATHNAQTYSTFSRSINDDLSANGYANATSVDSVSFRISTPGTTGGTDQLTMRYDDLTVENLKLGEGQTGTYVGQDHTLDDAEAAEVDLTLDNASATVTVTEQSSGTQLAQSTYSSSGTHTLSFGTTTSDAVEVTVAFEATGADPVTELNSEGIMFTGHAPELDNASASPSGGGTVTESPVELSINVSDAEFGSSYSESVDVTFYDASDDSVIGTDTVTSNGTASVDWDVGATGGGTLEWYAVAEDSYGLSTTSSTFSFTAPSELRILKETAPTELVDDDNLTLRVRFFSDDSDTVVERQVTDGTVDLSGLPVDERFIVTVRANETNTYTYRRIVIDSLFETQEVYLLNESEPNSQVIFELDDPTGQFPPTETTLYVEKAITKNGTTEYKTIAGDTFGSTGRFPVVLRNDDRYRLRIEDDDGDSSRILGSYSVYADTVEPLQIQRIAPSGDSDSGTALYGGIQESDDGRQLAVRFRDPMNETTEVEYRVLRGDGSVWISNTTRTSSEFADIYNLPANASEDETFVVEWTVTRGGETTSGSFVAGEVPGVADRFSGDIDPQVLSIASWLVILSTMGLLVIVNVALAPIGGTGMATALTIMGTVAIPAPMLGVSGAIGVLVLVGGTR